MTEMTNKEYGLSLLPDDAARRAYLAAQAIPPEDTEEGREVRAQHTDDPDDERGEDLGLLYRCVLAWGVNRHKRSRT